MAVNFVPGRQAKMTLFNDGVKGETIDLTLASLQTKEDLHALMVSKGFERMSEEQVKEAHETKRTTKTTTALRKTVHYDYREQRKRETVERRARIQQEREILGTVGIPSYLNMLQIYIGVGAVGVVIALYTANRRSKRRRQTSRVGVSS